MLDRIERGSPLAASRLPRGTSTSEAVLRPWLLLAIRVFAVHNLLVPLAHDMMFGPAIRPVWWDGLRDFASSEAGLAIRAGALVGLTLGFATRPAAMVTAAALWLLSATSAEARLLWSTLLVWIAVVGPGTISIDGLLRRGADSVAVPGASALRHVLDLVGRFGGDASLLVLRLWLAANLAELARPTLVALLPGDAFMSSSMRPLAAALPEPLLLIGALLLLAGALTRPVALVLLVLFALGHPASGDTRLPWALLLAVLALRGGGPYGLDHWIARWTTTSGPASEAAWPHVVVVGGGFGGVAAVQGLKRAACRVTLVDQRNHHLFQPLLYQVATASLSPGDIATPVRGLFRQQQNVRVLLGRAIGVDTLGKRLLTASGAIPFDLLVIATGARHGYLGHDEWSTFAPGLKTIEDAIAIRHRLLLAFEEAEGERDRDARQAWLTFVIVGGGPTGVELAGAVAELARHGLAEEFRDVDPATARVVLAHSGRRLLPSFPEQLSHEAERALEKLGVEVRLETRVEAVARDGVTIAGQLLPARTVLWAAGVMASPAAQWLAVSSDRSGRVLVGPDLTAPGFPEILVIGDTAASDAWAGQAVPGVAPAAKQQGAYAARVIRARLEGRSPPAPFRYRHFGNLATIGRRSAVADFGFVRLRGPLAWWLWGAAHVAFLVGGRNRMTVMVQWLWSYLTYRRGTRLITGDSAVDLPR